MIENLACMTLFTRIDPKDAFNQLQMHPDSEKFTTFSGQYGWFLYPVMPFGLSAAQAFFLTLFELTARHTLWKRGHVLHG
jgi:hypothetical protein